MRSSFVVGALAALIGGCKHDPAIALEDFDTAARAARCERFVRCGLFAAQEECEAHFRIIFDAARQPGIDQGLVKFDGVAAQQCFDAIGNQTCDERGDDGRRDPDVCTRVFTGSVVDGDACGSNLECASSRCKLDLTTCGSGECCAGTCSQTDPVAIGDTCGVNGDCEKEAFCDISTHVCKPLGAKNDQCLSDEQCQTGLLCATATFPGHCVETNVLGGACAELRCADIGAVCDASLTCVAAGFAGAMCRTRDDCSPFESCDLTTHLCRDLPTLGMSCDGQSCAGEAFCDATGTNTCTAPRANMEPCDTNFDCASQYCFMGPVFDECIEAPACL